MLFSQLMDPGALRMGLERELGRKVDFESLRFRLIPRPGLYAKRFVLHELPEFGAEPFLYARSMRCFLPVAVLWRWKFECGQVQLVEPSLNLTRSREGVWNLSKFGLVGGAGEGVSRRSALPLVTFVGGRVNFKEGDRKLRFALTGVRLRLDPAGDRRWSIQLDARPFRTDIEIGTTNDIRVRGEIDASQDGPAQFRLEAGWAASSIEQWVALVRGVESPYRAGIDFQLSVEGTVAEWSGTGNFTVADLRHREKAATESVSRWKGDGSIRYQAESDSLEIVESAIQGRETTVALSGAIHDPFGRFEWVLDASAELVDLGELSRQLSALTTEVPSETAFEGAASLTFHGETDRRMWTGGLETSSASKFILDADSPPVEIDSVRIDFQKGTISLQPVTLRFDSGATIDARGEVDLTVDTLPYRIAIESSGVDLALLSRTAAALGWTYPAADLLRGTADIDLAWSGQAGTVQPTQWDGTVTLRGGQLVAADLASPLEIPLASLSWMRGTLKIGPGEVVLGDDNLSFTLEKRIDRSYWTIGLEAERLDLDALHTLLHGVGEGLLDQLIGGERVRQIPWEEFWVRGSAAVKEMVAGPVKMTRVDARGEFRLNRLTLDRLRFRVNRGRFDGDLRADFLESSPRYRLAGNLRRVRLGEFLAAFSEEGPVLTGLMGAEVLLESSGDDMEGLWRDLNGAAVGSVRDGTITGLNILSALAGVVAAQTDAPANASTGVTQFQGLSGNLRLGNQTVETDELRLIVGGTALDLAGTARFDGSLDFRLTGRPLRVGRRRPSAAQQELFRNAFHLTGTARAPRLELFADPAPGQ